MTTDQPPGWTEITVAELCDVEYGKALRKKDRVENGTVGVYGSAGLVGHHNSALVDEHVVIVGRKGNAGSVWVAEKPSWPIDTTYFLRVPNGTSARFLGYQLEYLKLAVRDSSTTIPSLRRPDLEAVPVSLAPRPEQDRIVAAIEEHFSRLDAATSAASAAALKATASRRSVLLGAFSGRLSTRNCDDEPALMLLDRIVESRSQSKSQLTTTALRIDADVSAPQRELPPGWVWARLQDLSAAEPRAITDGPFGSNLKTAHYTETGPRVIRLQNIGDGEFTREDAHISPDHYESLLAHSVRQDDLIVASLGQSLPRACLVPNWVPPAIVKADCIRVRLHPEVNRSYVNLALQDPRLRRETDVDIKGVGRPRLGLQKIRQLPVPVAPRAEQDRIVAAVEEHFSRLTAANSAVSAAALKIQALRRAVLARAFAGQLVPQ